MAEKIKRKLSDKRWMMEFSKKILVALSICYIWMLLYAAFVMFYTKDISMLNVYIEQTTMVFSLGVVSYLLKSAIENVFKINSKHSSKAEKADECISDFENQDESEV